MSVTAAKGFDAAGTACGIKPAGAFDLALVATEDRRAVAAAAVTTTNRVAAAPVQVTRDHVADGRAAAIVLNSGNANAATGEGGRRAARATCDAAAAALGIDSHDVLVCSTGLIGDPLPAEHLTVALPGLAAALEPSSGAAARAADAILTTDTVRKEASSSFELGGRSITVGGMAKGAAMLAPAHATMLAVLTTDAPVGASVLHELLTSVVATSFDRLTIDGARSTNDTVIVLANGRVGGNEIVSGTVDHDALAGALGDVCRSLAEQMAADAEGATKIVRVHVTGARDDAEARLAARTVAESQLVKCSWYGEDPYWGRVLSELGASGVALDPEGVDIAYGDVTVCRDGVAAAHDEPALRAVMKAREIDLVCALREGPGSATILTTDLTHGYVDENMGTS